ncbi:MAG: NAD(P)-dependent oxidoreductase [Elusimicrobia bacterium]|nr:NAD(P)-dependent oxidoreductase [Elusimicrobiota bacterium]
MGNILIVGGAGYVGGALTDRLAQSGHKVRVYDSLVYEESYRKPVDFFLGDIRDWTALDPHLKWADAVVWLAALVGDGACAMDPKLTEKINRDSVGELSRRFGGRILFTSTCSVYGAQDGLLDEASPLNPLSLYAQTKMEAEKHLLDKNALVFRLGTLFGVGDTYSRIRLDLVVNVLTVKACLYNRISVFGGDQYRPLLHVRDVAEAIARNLETRHTGLYNLHSVNVRITDLADMFLRHFPGLEVHRTEVKFQDSRNYRVTSEKARRDLGFEAKWDLEPGMLELKALIEQNRIKNVAVPRHSNQRFLKEFLDRPASPLGYEAPTEI